MTRFARAIGTMTFVCWWAACAPKDPTPSSDIGVPYQLTTYYALERTDDGPYTARARYYDALQAFDWSGNAGTIDLSPGDQAFADGVALSTRTRTNTLGALRIDYAQSIPVGKPTYLFELRRPKETIEHTVPAPDPMTITSVSERDGITGVLDWSPAVKDAKVTISMTTSDAGCLLVAGDLGSNLRDTGHFEWSTVSYHVPDHDCTFVLTIARTLQKSAVPGRWKRDGQTIPANGAYVEHIARRSVSFVTKKR